MIRARRITSAVSVLVLCLAGHAQTQTPGRRLATIDTLRQFPGYYHLQSVLLRGQFVEHGARLVLRADDHDIEVLLAEGTTAGEGLVEVRGQVIDVGRLEPTDPRIARYDGAKDPERWPRPGEAVILIVNGMTKVDAATEATVRAVALEPWRFEGQTVTVTGQFRGRNLFGDLAGSPAKSKYDFVLRGAEGAVWITGLRPRGKTFDLDVDARVDTSRWVTVTGVVGRERTLVTIQASKIDSALPPTARTEAEKPPPPPPPMPAFVIFSSPTADETDTSPGSPVRLQFSRGLDPATIAGQITASYVKGDGPVTALEFKTSYDAATRAVELRFTTPLERFRTVHVETLGGLKAFDGAPVTPWTLTFSVGS